MRYSLPKSWLAFNFMFTNLGETYSSSSSISVITFHYVHDALEFKSTAWVWHNPLTVIARDNCVLLKLINRYGRSQSPIILKVINNS